MNDVARTEMIEISARGLCDESEPVFPCSFCVATATVAIDALLADGFTIEAAVKP